MSVMLPLLRVCALISTFTISFVLPVQADHDNVDHHVNLFTHSNATIATIAASGEEAFRTLVTQQTEDGSPRPFLDNDEAVFQDELLNFGRDDFICDEVSVSVVKLLKSGRRLGDDQHFATNPFEHRTDFSCVLQKTRPETTTGIHLLLQNVGPFFAQERLEAIAQNKTCLIVRNATIEGSTLIIPDQTDSTINGMASFTPVLEWQECPEGSKSNKRYSTRRLAQSQFGTKHVLIFRITVEDGNGYNAVPTKTPQEINDSIFGSNGDAVNLRSQYKACSYDQIDFVPAEDDILTSLVSGSVEGVIDIQVTVDSFFPSVHTIDIENAVYEKAESKTEDGGLGLDLQKYDHVMLMVPPGARYKGSTSWVAYAYKVRTNKLSKMPRTLIISFLILTS